MSALEALTELHKWLWEQINKAEEQDDNKPYDEGYTDALYDVQRQVRSILKVVNE